MQLLLENAIFIVLGPEREFLANKTGQTAGDVRTKLSRFYIGIFQIYFITRADIPIYRVREMHRISRIARQFV